jgi:hypothetical protein
MLLAQPGSERVHFGLRLPHRDARLELREDVVVLAAAERRGVRRHRQRQEDVAIFGDA